MLFLSRNSSDKSDSALTDHSQRWVSILVSGNLEKSGAGVSCRVWSAMLIGPSNSKGRHLLNLDSPFGNKGNSRWGEGFWHPAWLFSNNACRE